MSILPDFKTSFTSQSSNTAKFNIKKGELNKYKIRPSVINEQCESSGAVQGTVATANIVGQIFQASQDNINGMALTLESAAGAVIDNFETYADSAAAIVEWVKGGTDEVALETTIISPLLSSTKSLKLDSSDNTNIWTNTITSANLSGHELNLDMYFGEVVSRVVVAMQIGDGTETKTFTFNQENEDTWVHLDINEAAFVEDGVTPVDMTAVTKVIFKIVSSFPASFVYVDNIYQTPEGGSVNLKLWDMGTTIPVTTVTSIDDGDQYTEIGDRGIGGVLVSAYELLLEGGKRHYNIQGFVCGAATENASNTVLTVGNYYAITINYIATDVSVYGPDTSGSINYYDAGYAFTAPDEATAITAIGTYSDIAFSIFSTVDAWVNYLRTRFDAAPSCSDNQSIYVENTTKQQVDILATNVSPSELSGEALIVPVFMGKGYKFEIYHNDDLLTTTSTHETTIGYRYEKVATNGNVAS